MAHVTHSSAALPSNRSVGLLFTSVLAGLALYGYYRSWPTLLVGPLLLTSALTAATTLWAPQALTPLNKAWLALGALMGRVVNPVVLGIMFFGLITPFGLVSRWLGRDELRIRSREVDSYWIDRRPPGPPSESFKLQF